MKKSLPIIVVGLLCVVSGAQAGFTPLGGSGEPQLETAGGILDTLYTSQGYTWIRVDDFVRDLQGNPIPGAPLNPGLSGAGLPTTDQVWIGGQVQATTKVRFAGYSQELGYDLGANGGYTKLFDVSGNNYNVTGSGTLSFSPGQIWAWARANDSDNGLYNPQWSVNSLNADRRDHMLTYQILGKPTTTWVIAFEDITGWCSDWDYNDLIVEIQSAAPPSIPAPGAFLLGAIGVAAVGYLRRRHNL